MNLSGTFVQRHGGVLDFGGLVCYHVTFGVQQQWAPVAVPEDVQALAPINVNAIRDTSCQLCMQYADRYVL